LTFYQYKCYYIDSSVRSKNEMREQQAYLEDEEVFDEAEAAPMVLSSKRRQVAPAWQFWAYWSVRQRVVNGGIAAGFLILSAWASLPREGKDIAAAPATPQPTFSADLVRNIDKLPTISTQTKTGDLVPGVMELGDGFLKGEQSRIVNQYAQLIAARMAVDLPREGKVLPKGKKPPKPKCMTQLECLDLYEKAAVSRYSTAVANADLDESARAFNVYMGVQVVRAGAVDQSQVLRPKTFEKITSEVRNRRGQTDAIERELLDQSEAAKAAATGVSGGK
jgi:hypothetical protein